MKTFFTTFFFVFIFCRLSFGQVLCINCYRQNTTVSKNVTNFILNGSFEQTSCAAGGYFCPASNNYNCNITNWTCTGGGTYTYAQIFTSGNSFIPDGSKAAYFGNMYCMACSGNSNDTSCLIKADCTTRGVPMGYPMNTANYGGNVGVSLKQTVNGLIPGNIYALEFWTGGENGSFVQPGLFGLDVGFGDTLLRCLPSPTNGIAETYIVQFKANATSHTIKFTNWGHICSSCTELVLDNVRLYTLAQLSPTVLPCGSNLTPPDARFTANDSTLCENDCIDFTNTSTDAKSWLWTFNGGSPHTSAAKNPHICYLTAGLYNVMMVAYGPTGASDTITSSNFINVKASPPVPTIIQQDTLLYFHQDPSYTAYQWYDSVTLISGATDTFLIVNHSGNYNVEVSNANNCKIAVGITVYLDGLQDYLISNAVFWYPNPTSGKLIFEFKEGNAKNIQKMELFNMLGMQVLSSSLSPAERSTGRKEMDVSPLAGGIYYLVFSGEKGRGMGRFVKE